MGSAFEPLREWQIRCPACGRVKSLQEAGGLRIGWGVKRTLIWCSQCRSLRWAFIEPKPE